MEEIVDLWKELVLTGDEDTVVPVADDCPFLSLETVDLCVVGRLLLSKKINVEAFHSVMKSIWHVHQGTQIRSAGENLFVIQFHSRADKCRVLNSGPWSFDKGLLVLVAPGASDQLSDLCFTKVSFWVQIHNVPFKCLNRDMAMQLGNCLGKMERVDCEGQQNWVGAFLGVRVTIDITKPLRRGIKLRLSGDKEVWCPIQYEKLPDFCYQCGKLGHSIRECDVPVAGLLRSGLNQYGDWLRAPIFRGTSLHRDGMVAGVKDGRGNSTRMVTRDCSVPSSSFQAAPSPVGGVVRPSGVVGETVEGGEVGVIAETNVGGTKFVSARSLPLRRNSSQEVDTSLQVTMPKGSEVGHSLGPTPECA